jgi:hypothetical protein
MAVKKKIPTGSEILIVVILGYITVKRNEVIENHHREPSGIITNEESVLVVCHAGPHGSYQAQ